MDFGAAIKAMKAGKKVARTGWNGKGMWLALSGVGKGPSGGRVTVAADLWNAHSRAFAEQNGGEAEVLPTIIMKTALGQILMGWLASQTDMLAEDWMVVESVEPGQSHPAGTYGDSIHGSVDLNSKKTTPTVV